MLHVFSARLWRPVLILVCFFFCSGSSLLSQEALTKALRGQLPVEQPMRIFEYVFEQLPDEVDVLPSENYYYFQFASHGSWYWGNLRLSPGLRDEGKLHFAYARYQKPETQEYLLIDQDDNVKITKVSDYKYRVKFNGKSVLFRLNEIPQHSPLNYQLRPWEKFIARSEDESGLRFLLFYNNKYKHFFWTLDQEQLMEVRLQSLGDSLFLQPYSKFVFYNDSHDNRYVLAAVERSNITANNYHDGPFDQLADNILDKTPFADYLQDAYIETRGNITRHAEMDNGMRVAIIPYLSYINTNEVIEYQVLCRQKYPDVSGFYFCFFRDQTRRYLDEERYPMSPGMY